MKAGDLMRAIAAYAGQPATRAALNLSALLFLRPGNIRQMRWENIDLEKALWTIPAADMKRTEAARINGRPHLVPLAIAILEDLKPLTGHGEYVFPSLLTGERPMIRMTHYAITQGHFENEQLARVLLHTVKNTGPGEFGLAAGVDTGVSQISNLLAGEDRVHVAKTVGPGEYDRADEVLPYQQLPLQSNTLTIWSFLSTQKACTQLRST